MMVESEADCLAEDVMLWAVVFGHEQMQTAITAINELAAEAGKPKWQWEAPPVDDELDKAVAAAAESGLSDAYRITDKKDRQASVGDTKATTTESLAGGVGLFLIVDG